MYIIHVHVHVCTQSCSFSPSLHSFSLPPSLSFSWFSFSPSPLFLSSSPSPFLSPLLLLPCVLSSSSPLLLPGCSSSLFLPLFFSCIFPITLRSFFPHRTFSLRHSEPCAVEMEGPLLISLSATTRASNWWGSSAHNWRIWSDRLRPGRPESLNTSTRYKIIVEYTETILLAFAILIYIHWGR